MKNKFFVLAISTASRFAGRPSRLLVLAARFIFELRRTKHTRLDVAATREKFGQLGRLVTAYARGKYRRIPLKPVISIAAAMLYFLNPFDLVPDAIPGLGITDDLAVLTWVYQSFVHELTAFREWEQTTAQV